MGTPSAQTLVDMASVMFQELEEVPMTMVGGLDVHRQQITFDYVDDDGLVHWGQIRPATRKTLRGWLAEHCPDGDGEFALEGCTGWRYVSEELAAAGMVAHLGDPAETAALRGPKKRAKTDRADARLLRTLLVEGRFRSRSRGASLWPCRRPAGCHPGRRRRPAGAQPDPKDSRSPSNPPPDHRRLPARVPHHQQIVGSRSSSG